jgi:hypothetical protein
MFEISLNSQSNEESSINLDKRRMKIVSKVIIRGWGLV